MLGFKFITLTLALSTVKIISGTSFVSGHRKGVLIEASPLSHIHKENLVTLPPECKANPSAFLYCDTANTTLQAIIISYLDQ